MNPRIHRNGFLRKSPFKRTTDYGIDPEITNRGSRGAATGAIAPGFSPGSPPKITTSPGWGRRSNRPLQPGQQVRSPSPCRRLTLDPSLARIPVSPAFSWRYYECRAFIESDSSENSPENVWCITFKTAEIKNLLSREAAPGT